MNTVLMVGYLTCFQLCALPSIVRIVRRQSSADLSIWREVLLIMGASLQLAVMVRTGAAWQVCISPLASICSVLLLLAVIRRYR